MGAWDCTCRDRRGEARGDIKDREARPVVDCSCQKVPVGVPCQGSYWPCTRTVKVFMHAMAWHLLQAADTMLQLKAETGLTSEP